ncbi:mitochondrial export translocase [Sporothrix brasiliensis 5110]|uniref:Mitochondrial export translocase n=1 Tax=Sporothrix brasiliensis 5110 TaxID=1398154 RepID=A0A0C2IWD7_9PEZI|nr:mitochondrial export translocase [Sporothrix brasiliensis 5110]KIH91095.1 mitochondrial export translocase [Sporothrix brasiliensis 5110]
MLPSRGLVQSSQALRLRQVTSRAGCARNFSTALRSRSGSPATAASGLALGQLSGRRAGAAALSGSHHSTNSTHNLLRTNMPSSAAAFSLWPFSSGNKSFKEGDILPAVSQTPTTPPPPSSSSTATPAPTEFVPEPPASTTSASAFPDPADPAALSDLLDGSALLDMAENQIGYLHALGLDFGWGPTSLCQWLLEHVHVYTGLPWWASIVGVALLFRAAIFLPSLTAAEQSAKLQVLRKNPRYAAAMAEMQASAFKGGAQGQGKAMEARLTMKRMQEAMDVSTWKMFVPMINIPFGYGMFRLLRATGALPVPGMETGGILWFTDLTVADPYFVLPLASAGIMYLIFRTNMKYMAPEQQQTMKYIQMAITPISVLVTIKMSAGLTFFFLTSSVLQMIQTWLWHQPWLRAWKGLPPMHEMLQGGALNNLPGGGSAHQQQAARPVAFRVDPNSSWKAPRATSTGFKEAAEDAASETSQAAKAEELLTKPPSAVEVAKKGWGKLMGTAKEKQAASKDKELLRKAQDYEKRRAMEDETQAYHRREAERQYRAAKKTLDGKQNKNSKWQ